MKKVYEIEVGFENKYIFKRKKYTIEQKELIQFFKWLNDKWLDDYTIYGVKLLKIIID